MSVRQDEIDRRDLRLHLGRWPQGLRGSGAQGLTLTSIETFPFQQPSSRPIQILQHFPIFKLLNLTDPSPQPRLVFPIPVPFQRARFKKPNLKCDLLPKGKCANFYAKSDARNPADMLSHLHCLIDGPAAGRLTYFP